MSKELQLSNDANIRSALSENTSIPLDAVLSEISETARSVVHEGVETAKGRKQIASIAYAVSRKKTMIDDIGKNLVSDQKKSIGLIDEARRYARAVLDDLKDEVRKPLTEWEVKKKEEEEESARVIQQKEAEIKAKKDKFEKMMREQREKKAQKLRENMIAEKAAIAERLKSAKKIDEQKKLISEQEAEMSKNQKERVRLAEEARDKIEQENKRTMDLKRQIEDAESAKNSVKAGSDMPVDRVNRVDRLVVKSIMDAGIPQTRATLLLEIIKSGLIPELSISYDVERPQIK